GLTPEISVLACGDARIAVLNRDFRDKPVATNVLSWPSVERGATQDGDLPEALDAADDPEIGDIAISLQTCLREAEEMNKPVEHHVLHLVVHAILHLLGYDHERDKDAALMEHTETEILASLGVPDPY
ncbi:MAG TPA: rRNA maturation RNase YbeY, partial [Aliiroseovarius sp.]|nr:rRNA maturation RNase YbeY [Aliiroseovarius sp.]